MRTVIVGGPRTGKTTKGQELATQQECHVHHTDDVKHLGWSESSERVSIWMDMEGSWVIEGVATVRALRKWMERNAEGAPCDRVILLNHQYEEMKPGQESMRKGVITVLDEIRPLLEARGLEVEGSPQPSVDFAEEAETPEQPAGRTRGGLMVI